MVDADLNNFEVKANHKNGKIYELIECLNNGSNFVLKNGKDQ